MHWHQRPISDVLHELRSSASGLTAGEVEQRLARYGRNVLTHVPPRSAWRILLAQFADFMILVLVGAAVISGVIGDVTDTVIIIAIVVLNAAVGFFQEFRAERAMEALKAMAAPSATVLRDGRVTSIIAADLVPGDIVRLDAGCIVPADLRLAESHSLRVDEAVLTGESVPIDKIVEPIAVQELPLGDRRNIAFKGTHVTYGRGTGVVFATGMDTEFGRIARLLQQAQAVDTPLQRRLGLFGRRLALAVGAICAIVFATGLLRGEAALPMLLTALSLAVAAIPEALPAVVSISLALGARKLIARQALIRRLPAVETLGSVTFICTDKTGTLTANEMRVEQYYCDGQRATIPGESLPWQTLMSAMSVSHDTTAGKDGSLSGDPTEVALVRAAQAAGFIADEQSHLWPRVDEIPFDSGRKCMTTIHRDPQGGWLSITKGAVEVIIAASPSAQRGDGRTDLDAIEVIDVADQMAAQGLRVLAIGVRRWPEAPAHIDASVVERELDFVGLIGMIDPPRPEAAAAIAACRDAGIVPVMITGDHPLTARAVAARLGLDAGEESLITGPELERMPMTQFIEAVKKLRVYARVAPEQKLKIVEALQRQGEIVAMTGDGVNDAPALRRADIGVAMGIAGTDVAREAGSVVLLDDNFATIVRAVREGRRIYDNLRRFVRYVLTTNSGEIWTIFLAPFLGLPVPLLPIQILWINLVTDGLPGLALSSEPAEAGVMKRPPRPPAESLFAQGLGAHALLVGLLMAAFVLSAQAWYFHLSSDQWQTIVFTALCFAQLGHVLAIRSEKTSLFVQGLFSNRPLLAAVVLTIILQLLVVYHPLGNAWFKTVPLDATGLLVCCATGFAIFAVVEVEKAVRRGMERERP